MLYTKTDKGIYWGSVKCYSMNAAKELFFDHLKEKYGINFIHYCQILGITQTIHSSNIENN